MKKSLIWICLILGIEGMAGGYYLGKIKRDQVKYELPITSKVIAGEPNTYGAYLGGFLAEQHQKYDDSVRLFETALKTNPDSKKLKETVYLLKAVRGEIAEVLPLAQELQQLKRPELLTDYVLIAEAVRQNDFKKAGDLLVKKTPYGADSMLSPVIRSWIEVDRKNKKKAYAALEELKKEERIRAFYYYYKALVAMAFHEDNVAEESFEQMSRLSEKGYPSLAAVLFLKDFYQKKGMWKAGQVDYERLSKSFKNVSALQQIIQNMKAPEITPKIGVAVSFYDMSVALSPLKLQETCLILNELALYITPQAVLPKIWGGELMEAAGNYRMANKIYLKMPNQTDVIRFKIAMNMIAAEDYQEASRILEDILRRNKKDALLWYVTGDLYVKLSQYDKAIKYYSIAAELFQKAQKNKEAAQVKMAQAYVYEKLGKKESIEELLKETLALNPNDPLALNYLGYVWLERKERIPEAFQMIQKANELAPDNANIMDSLALGYYLKKDYGKALELAEKATDQLPYSSVAYQHLGDIYEALGRNREAAYQYQRALTLKEDLTSDMEKEIERKLTALAAKKKPDVK